MRKTVAAGATNAPGAYGKDEEIFSHAVRIFKEKGYHATSVQDIADAVGLQKGSLYHYIRSKDELLFRIFERSTGALTRDLEAIVASRRSPRDKLSDAIAAHLTALCEQLDIYTVYLSERRALGARNNSKVRAEGERHARLIEQIIQEGVAQGEWRAVDSRMAALAIIGMCNWLYQWYTPNGRLTPRQIAGVFSDLVIDGLAVSRP
ncbi:MAG: TetR/AcrR family transcriptional regulator [Chloroflexi bacterium]|nr:TetR/AcrR family transcriptional regulator [Chloroflexota bacterium]